MEYKTYIVCSRIHFKVMKEQYKILKGKECMEEEQEVKKKKKIEISLGMAIFLFAIFLVIIVGVIVGAILINKNKDKVVVNEEIIQVNANGIVYTAFEEKSEGYSYSIPKINIDSEDVEKINNEIEEKIIKKAKEEVEYSKEFEEGFVGEPANISYNYYINSEILSLVIEQGYVYDYIEYMVYNVNIKTGKKCTNEEVVAFKGISANEFTNKLPEIYGERFEDAYGSMVRGGWI